MKRPGQAEKVLERIQKWRDICPEIVIRSTFIVGFPGETEEDFQMLLDWLEEAQLDRVGCFKYSAVKGAKANEIEGQVNEDVKEERYARFMEKQQAISTNKLKSRIGTTMSVLIDEVDEEGAIGRTFADAPEIDGMVYLNGETSLEAGQLVDVNIDHSDEYDLWASSI
jgi:ribosomal protein S12 methylthiotransferase